MTQEEMLGRMTQNFMALMERSIKAQEVANQLKAIEIAALNELIPGDYNAGRYADMAKAILRGE